MIERIIIVLMTITALIHYIKRDIDGAAYFLLFAILFAIIENTEKRK